MKRPLNAAVAHSGVARPQFLGEHIDINKLLLINIYFNRKLLPWSTPENLTITVSESRPPESSLSMDNNAMFVSLSLRRYNNKRTRPQFLGEHSSPNVPPMFPQCSPVATPLLRMIRSGT